MMEVAIPWSMLGEACAPPSSREMRMNIQVRDRRSNALLFETIPEALDKASWTWPELTLVDNTGASFQGISFPARSVIHVDGSRISVESSFPISGLEVYDIAGAVVALSSSSSIEMPGKGIYIVKVRYVDGSGEHQKIYI